jgi:hypothetical protein
MRPWSEIARAEPEIAAAGQRLLETAEGEPTVAFLATVGADARPRMHPFIPAVVGGRLWAFVVLSPKQRDLDRDRSYAIHSMLGPHDESFLVSGIADRIDDDPLRALVASHMPYDDTDARHILYEFLVDRALWTTWTTPTTPVYRRWHLTDD